MADSQSKVIKITKNLDFGGHEIDMDGFFDYSVSGDASNISFTGIEVNGGGMILSNLNLKNAWSVFPQSTYAIFHDIHVRDANLYINGSAFNNDAIQQQLSLIRGVAGYGLVYNASITGVLHVNGDINPTGERHVLTIYSDAHIDNSTQEVKSSSFSSLDVQYTNTTLTGTEDNLIAFVFSNIPNSVTYTTSQTTYSESNVYNVFAYIAAAPQVTVYIDSSKTIVIPAESGVTVVDKTWDEMKSDGFVDLLNSYQDVFFDDFNNVNNGFPVFMQGTMTLEYDGYVKDSTLKNKLNEIQNAGKDKVLDEAIKSLLEYYSANTTDGALSTTITDDVIPDLKSLIRRTGSYSADVSGLILGAFGLPMKSCDVICMSGEMSVAAYVNHPADGFISMGVGINAGINSDGDITLEATLIQNIIQGGDKITISIGAKSVVLANTFNGRDNYVLNERGEYVKMSSAEQKGFTPSQQDAIIDAFNNAMTSAENGTITQDKYDALASAMSTYPPEGFSSGFTESIYVRKSNFLPRLYNGRFAEGYVRKYGNSFIINGELYDPFRYKYVNGDSVLENNIVRRMLEVVVSDNLTVSVKERSITFNIGGYGDEFLSADGTYKRISGSNPDLGEVVYKILSHYNLPSNINDIYGISYDKLKSSMGGRDLALFGMPNRNMYYSISSPVWVSGTAALDKNSGDIEIRVVAMGYNMLTRTEKNPSIKFGNYIVKSDGSMSNGEFYTRKIDFDAETTVSPYSLMSLGSENGILNSLTQLPIESKTIKVELSESSELSFASTPEEESEYTVYVRNNSNSDITQQIKTNDSWKCKMGSVNIPAGEIVILHIRYAFSSYLVSVDLFN